MESIDGDRVSNFSLPGTKRILVSFSVDHIAGVIRVYASSLSPFSRKASARGLVTCVPASLVELVAAGVQDYFAVPDFSARYAILVGVFDHVASQRFPYS